MSFLVCLCQSFCFAFNLHSLIALFVLIAANGRFDPLCPFYHFRFNNFCHSVASQILSYLYRLLLFPLASFLFFPILAWSLAILFFSVFIITLLPSFYSLSTFFTVYIFTSLSSSYSLYFSISAFALLLPRLSCSLFLLHFLFFLFFNFLRFPFSLLLLRPLISCLYSSLFSRLLSLLAFFSIFLLFLSPPIPWLSPPPYE